MWKDVSLYNEICYGKGYELVGAIDINPNIIGKDVSTLLGGNELGIKIRDAKDAEELLREVKPNIVIITTMSLMNDVKDSLLLCAKLGINAITTCEEAFYPFNSSPKLSEEIDELAKKIIVQLLVVVIKMLFGVI